MKESRPVFAVGIGLGRFPGTMSNVREIKREVDSSKQARGDGVNFESSNQIANRSIISVMTLPFRNAKGLYFNC
jgi:hypothetical protein